MKRAYAIAILLILSFNGAGFYVYYFLQLHQIKSEMRAAIKKLPAIQLDIISLSRVAFEEALVEEHEMEVNDKMYDIAWIEDRGETLVVFCKHDAMEDDLLALLDFVINSPENDGHNMPLSVYQIISLIGILPSHFQSFRQDASSIMHITPYEFQLTHFYTRGFFVPPRGSRS